MAEGLGLILANVGGTVAGNMAGRLFGGGGKKKRKDIVAEYLQKPELAPSPVVPDLPDAPTIPEIPGVDLKQIIADETNRLSRVNRDDKRQGQLARENTRISTRKSAGYGGSTSTTSMLGDE